MTAPRIRPLGPSDETALEAFLQQRIDASMFLLGNMRHSGLVDGPAAYQGAYAAAFEGPNIVAAAAHYWNGNLILQAPAHFEAVWRAAMRASARPLRGVLGPADQVGRVRVNLAISPNDVQIDKVEILYSLDLDRLVVPPILAGGQVKGRSLTEADLPLLVDWRLDFEAEALGQAQTAEARVSARASVKRSLTEGRLWLLEGDDGPLAMSAFNIVMGEAVQVGGVWTPPDLRRRGYGRAVVAVSLLEARASGVPRAILFTDEDNLPARRAYKALGFRPVGDYRILILRRPVRPAA